MSKDKTKNGVKKKGAYKANPAKVKIPKKFEAKGKKSHEARGHKGFKAGNPGGPGRPKMTDMQKKAAKINRKTVRGLIHYYLALELEEIRSLYKPEIPKTLPSIHYIIMGIIIQAGVQGDQNKAEWLWSQVWGKLSDTIEIDLKDNRTADSMFGKDIPAETLRKIIELLKNAKEAKENGDK